MSKDMPVMAMAGNVDNEPKPCLYIRDKQIDKYLPESFDSLDVDDEVELKIKFKVVSKSKNDSMESEYDDDGKEKGKKQKTHRSLELEVIDSEDAGSPNFKRYNSKI